MPRLNPIRGNVASGAGGHQGSVDRNYVANGYGPHWLNADEIVYPTFDGKLATKNPYTNAAPVIVSERGSSSDFLRAGGGVWAAWVNGYGLWSSTGWHDAAAGLKTVGPEGQIGYTPIYQEGVGCNVRLINGDTWQLSASGVVYDLQLLTNFRAVWTFQNNVYVHGMPPPKIVPGGVWAPKMSDDGAFICYFSGSRGVIVHRCNDASRGWVFAGPGTNAYNHDMAMIDGVLHVVASSGAGENPNEWWMAEYVPGTTPMVAFEDDVVVYPITPINKPMWLAFFTGAPGASGGWDTNDDPGGAPPPGNARLDVPTLTVLDTAGRVVGAFITGGSVEEIEQKAAASTVTPICYWDSRRWPRMPNLPDGAWLCVQAYRNRTEPLANFEADIRRILEQHIAERPNLKHAIVPQCYTS